MQTPPKKRPIYKVLYVQVIVAIILGILLGHFYPNVGESFKPLGDGFIKIVKMIIAPVIFLTVVTGIAGMNNMKTVGKVAGKSMIYFLTFSSIALVIGLITANIIRPGDGLNISPESLDSSKVEMYVTQAHNSSLVSFLMNIIPDTVVSPLVNGNILQVLFVSIIFGISLA
ncbi:sodium:dicarboxylate symporter, partial [Proteus hauseri ATCC 700826]